MKCLFALSCAALLSAPSVPEHGPIYSGMPPQRLQGDNIQVVIYVEDVTALCGGAPPGYRIHACHFVQDGTPFIVLPNPCQWGDIEYTARLACHELGHRNGWGHNHEVE